MIYALTLIVSGLTAYFGHELGEKKLKSRRQDIRLKISGYHIHHSVFGLTAILIAVLFTGGIVTVVLLGYGTGNLWQHKTTHNRQNESGFVFFTKLATKNKNV